MKVAPRLNIKLCKVQQGRAVAGIFNPWEAAPVACQRLSALLVLHPLLQLQGNRTSTCTRMRRNDWVARLAASNAATT